MKTRKVNWFGLFGGITTIILVTASLAFAFPWWQLTVGDKFVEANVSPLNTNFNLFGTALTIPLIWALNLASLLSLVASCIAMLIYSLGPTKSYSRHLLDFAYKKPLIALLVFVITLSLAACVAGAMFQFNIPLIGSATEELPTSMTQGIEIAVPIVSGFTWMFYLAILSACLCVAAKLFHHKLVQETDLT